MSLDQVRVPSPPGTMHVLLVEDDDGDALLVSELFAETDAPVELHRATSIAEAEPGLDGADCVLLDLQLPDAVGFDGLRRLLRPGGPAVLVLTGRRDEQLGADAVGVGAQDYLVKDAIDGPLLSRAVRYAVERRRADLVRHQLQEAQLRAAENARLERGLLPSPLLADPALAVAARYEPGAEQTLLGGDFYDVVERPDGTVHLLVGDVCGHGPDEAALGVSLRIAWRTLVLSGLPPHAVMPTLQELLVHERHAAPVFTTLCAVAIEPDRRRLSYRLAGHPPPVLLTPEGPRELCSERRGLPLGILPGGRWDAHEVALPERFGLLLYTDGLIEGRPDDGGDVLWTDGLVDLLRDLPTAGGSDPSETLDALLGRVRALERGRADDLAAVLLVSGR